MAYTAEISRGQPGCFLFLIDRSDSMNDDVKPGVSKAAEVATMLNRVLQELIIRCSKGEGVRDYFHVGVIGYQDEAAHNALSALTGAEVLVPISTLAAQPLRCEQRPLKVSDGAGGLVETLTTFPVWCDATASGATPMCAALKAAADALAPWCNAHPRSFPPVVLHLTDGAATDGDPEPIAGLLHEIGTSDGGVLLLNVHIAALRGAREIVFPDSEEVLDDEYARILFRMSSPLVGGMLTVARAEGFDVDGQSRGFMYNVRTERVVQFFSIGTRPAQVR